MFTERQQLQLKAVARLSNDPNFGKINERLEEALMQLYLEMIIMLMKILRMFLLLEIQQQLQLQTLYMLEILKFKEILMVFLYLE